MAQAPESVVCCGFEHVCHGTVGSKGLGTTSLRPCCGSRGRSWKSQSRGLGEAVRGFTGETHVCPQGRGRSLSRVRLFVTPLTVQPMGFSRPEYCSGELFPSPGDLPNQGSNPGVPRCRRILYQLSHQGSPSVKSQS